MFFIDSEGINIKKTMLFLAAVILFMVGAILVAPTEQILLKVIDFAKLTVAAFG